jgi:ATP-dependent DNA ligase
MQSSRFLEASTAREPPAGPGWIHEIKHDGFRILARKDAHGVPLIMAKTEARFLT